MKPSLLCILVLALLSGHSWSQAPLPQAKPSTPARKLTAKDIRVLPFVREFKEQKFKSNDREVPDELRATVTSGTIHLYGKKRGEVTRIAGRPSGHVGKVVLLPPGDRVGKVTVKAPSAEEVAFYFAVIELADALDTKTIKLATGKTYDWSVKSENGQTTFRVLDAGSELAILTAPTDKLAGVGFAATVRSKGNEADMSIVLP